MVPLFDSAPDTNPTEFSSMKTLKDLFLDQLGDVYYTEKQLTKALPKIAKAAYCEPLREALEFHLDETEGHVRLVESAFKSLGMTPRAKKCQGIVGILKEGDRMILETQGSAALDAAIIAAAQKVEHYEITLYGCLVEWAIQLDAEEAANHLDRILGEEKIADKGLTMLARGFVNDWAEGESEDDGFNGQHKGWVVPRPTRSHALV